MGGWELSGEDELETELSFAGSAFGDEFSYGLAGDSAAEVTV